MRGGRLVSPGPCGASDGTGLPSAVWFPGSRLRRQCFAENTVGGPGDAFGFDGGRRRLRPGAAGAARPEPSLSFRPRRPPVGGGASGLPGP